MIQYTLKCDDGHGFDSWFQSSDAFDRLMSAGHISCAVCGSSQVSKAMMSPRVTTSRQPAKQESGGAVRPSLPEKAPRQPVAMAADADMRRALSDLRKRVETQSDYVGDRFAHEARAMHLGDAPERSIYGEATANEARSLVEDGVPVMPLPFTPTRKTN